MAQHTPPTYGSYLQLEKLLDAQAPLSRPEAHDELQFIVVHQAYELWFKLMLHEVDSTVGHLQAGEVGPAYWLMRRCIEIGRVLLQQINVMETMSPARFLEFRDVLNPASGLQSAQFRALEFRSGLRDPRYLELYQKDAAATALLKSSLEAPTLWDGFCALLVARGFDVSGHEAQLQALVEVYTDPKQFDLHQLAEAFIEYDETFRLWRTRHYLMAERMIGFKPGTGLGHTTQMGMTSKEAAESPRNEAPHAGEGAGEKAGGCPFGHGALPRTESGPSFQVPGVAYLQGRAALRYFPALWELRSRLGAAPYGA